MWRALIQKNWQESRWLVAGCALGLFAFCWLRVWIVGRLDTGRFKAILDLLPSDWQRFAPVDVSWLITYGGRVSLTFSEPAVLLCISVWSIARGSDCVSGELNRGTMELLLAQPVRRRDVILSSSGMMIAGSALLAASAWLGTWTGIQRTMIRHVETPAFSLPFEIPGLTQSETSPEATARVPMASQVDAQWYLPSSLALFSLGVWLGGFTSLVSAADRFRWRTIGIVVSVYVIQWVLKVTSRATDSLAWLERYTIMSAYEPEKLAATAAEHPERLWQLAASDANGAWTGLGPAGGPALLLVTGLLMHLAAVFVLSRRDLPAPI